MRLSNRGLMVCTISLAVGSSVIGIGGGVVPASFANAASATPGVTAKAITVGQIDDISAPIPGIFLGAKTGTEAYFAYINSKGGVNGRMLKVDAKDSAFSSGTVTNETKSIAANDFAMVGGYTLLDGAEQPVIDANKLPTVSQVLDTGLYTDPNVYSAIPLVQKNGVLGEATGPYKWLAQKYPKNVKAVGSIGSNAAASTIIAQKSVELLSNSVGWKWLYTRNASYTETTFLPDMIKMKDAGVKLVYVADEPSNYASTIVQEMKQQGLNALSVVGIGQYAKAFDPGAAGNGTILTGNTSLYRGEDANVIPAVSTFDKWVKKIDPGTQLDLFTLYGWISAELFAQALAGTGPNPTRSSLVSQLNKVTSFNANGLISAQDPADRLPGQCWLAAEYENGAWHRISPDPTAGFVCNPGGFFPASYKGHPHSS